MLTRDGGGAFSPRDDNPALAFLPLSRPRKGSKWIPYSTVLGRCSGLWKGIAVESANNILTYGGAVFLFRTLRATSAAPTGSRKVPPHRRRAYPRRGRG